MNWQGAKDTLKKGAELVQQKSSDAIDYLRSEEFSDKVSNVVHKTKEGVSSVVEGVKNNETAQAIASKTKEVYTDIKNSSVVQKIGEKSKDLKDSILGKEEQPEEQPKKSNETFEF